jgi:hypothetical protein
VVSEYNTHDREEDRMGNPESYMKPVDIPRRRLNDNIEVVFEETWLSDMDWVSLDGGLLLTRYSVYGFHNSLGSS